MNVAGIDTLLDLMGVAVTVLAIHHLRNRCRYGALVDDLAVASEALDLDGMSRMLLAGVGCELLGVCVNLVQFHAVRLMFEPVVMTVEADCGRDICRSFDFSLMAGILAARLVRDEFRMIDRDEPSLDNLVRHLVTTSATGLDQPDVSVGAFEEMACETDFSVYAEVLIASYVAMAQTTGDPYPVDRLFNVGRMGEFHAAVDEILRLELLSAVALRSHTGIVFNRGVGLGADSADHTGHGLGQTVDLALDISLETGLQVAIEAVHLGMLGVLPALVIGIHDVAGVAEAGLARDYDRPTTKENHDDDQ
jgi:hypothetical protein